MTWTQVYDPLGHWWLSTIVAAVPVVVLLGAGSYITSHNHMVALNQQVDSAYSQVDIEQQRRLDLIPNLVASVKGYVKEEETVLTNIANARAALETAVREFIEFGHAEG